MLQISDYSVAYGQSTIIGDLNLTLNPNEIIAVLGRNGMGKTTLMKSLIGMIPSQGGSVTLKNKELTPLKSFERVAAGVGFVPQGRMIFSTMTVKENIETGLTSTGKKVIPSDLYELFPVLDEMKDRRGGNLSGGQQQQLAIARALASEPSVLLLDEPTEGIQPNIVHEIGDIIIRLNQERGMTILLVEQKLPFARRVAQHFYILDKGRNVAADKMENLGEEVIDQFLKV